MILKYACFIGGGEYVCIRNELHEKNAKVVNEMLYGMNGMKIY